MSNLNDIVSVMKIPLFFRDMIYLIGGFLFLMFLNYYYSPDLNELPNIEFFEGFGVYLGLFTISYIAGRLLVLSSNVYLSFILLFFIEDRRKKLNNWFTEFITYLNSNTTAVPHRESYVPSAEIYSEIQNNQHLFNILERNVYDNLFSRVFLGIALFCTVFVSFYFTILVIVFTIIVKIRDIEGTRSNIDIVEFLNKKGKSK